MILNLHVLSEELIEILDARISAVLNRICRTSASKKDPSEGNESSKRRPLPLRKTDRLPDLRVLADHWNQWFCRELCRSIYSCLSKWYSGIRRDKDFTWWNPGKFVQIKNTRVWQVQDRVGIVWPGDSSEDNRTWLSQIEKMVKRSIEQNLGMKNFEVRNGNYETSVVVKNQEIKNSVNKEV